MARTLRGDELENATKLRYYIILYIRIDKLLSRAKMYIATAPRRVLNNGDYYSKVFTFFVFWF